VRKPKSLREAVWMTLLWFDLFDQPVSAEEVHRYLFFRKAKLADVRTVLDKDHRVGCTFGLYFRQGRIGITFARVKRQWHASTLWARTLAHRFIFRHAPFVRFVGVGNTLAFGWPDSASDIDLFVICDRKRLFTARLALTCITHLFSMRRHGGHIAGRFCLSFFASPAALDLAEIKIDKCDPYLAFWVATLTPVWGNTGRQFFQKNAWIKDYFPNLHWPATHGKIDREKSFERGGLERLLSGEFGDNFETLLRNWQLDRARAKRKNKQEKTAVIINDDMLKFHESDRRRELLKRWKEKIEK